MDIKHVLLSYHSCAGISIIFFCNMGRMVTVSPGFCIYSKARMKKCVGRRLSGSLCGGIINVVKVSKRERS